MPGFSVLFLPPARFCLRCRGLRGRLADLEIQQDLPDYTQLKNYEPPVMTRVHAGDGSILAEYAHERRLYLPAPPFRRW